MREVRFQQVDVFTAVPFQGNPVAVVFDGDRFADDEMQRIANWTNLSETTFVCRPTNPEADYRLRIFTPRAELPFAGHPTIGSAHAVLRAGLRPRTPERLVQECAKGLIALKLGADRIALALPTPVFVEPSVEEVAAAANALGVGAGQVARAGFVDVGPIWLTLQLRDAAAVVALRPEMDRLATARRAERRASSCSASIPRARRPMSKYERSRRRTGCLRIRCAAAATEPSQRLFAAKDYSLSRATSPRRADA